MVGLFSADGRGLWSRVAPILAQTLGLLWLSAARRAGLSVSGLSSGADFAVQFQVAFSSRVTGAAIFAGQPFQCAVRRFPGDQLQPPTPDVPICVGCPPNSTVPYDHCKRNSSVVDVSLLAAAARSDAARGFLDDLSHLAKARIYLYRGTKDAHYDLGSVAKTRDFFRAFVPPSQLLYKGDVPSGHAYPLPGWLPWICGAPLLPFENCGYDGLGSALQHIYGALNPPAARAAEGVLKWFDQSPFFGDRGITGLDDWGAVYVPEACETSPCDLHINFHGCGFTMPLTFRFLVAGLDLNRWAESNSFVVLYPQLRSHGSTEEFRQGCWNVYGQTGRDYAARQAPQMAAIMAMADDIALIIQRAGPRVIFV